MSRRTIAIAAALTLLALGSPLIFAKASPLARQYYDQALDKYDADNYQGAIDDFNRAIAFDRQNADAYFFRAYAKDWLEDYEGAIADYTKVIEIDPNYSGVYYSRGTAKYLLYDYQGCNCCSYNKAIEINPQDALVYYFRGSSKERISDFEGACDDWRKSANLGDEGRLFLLVETEC